jgi:uncharacterized membrane protein YgcG
VVVVCRNVCELGAALFCSLEEKNGAKLSLSYHYVSLQCCVRHWLQAADFCHFDYWLICVLMLIVLSLTFCHRRGGTGHSQCLGGSSSSGGATAAGSSSAASGAAGSSRQPRQPANTGSCASNR